MSNNPASQSQEIMDDEEGEEYINMQEVAEIVEDDDGPEPMDEDQEMDDGDDDTPFDENGNIEIDLANNSEGYFEQHKDSIFTVATHPSLPIAVTGGGDNTAYLWTTHTNPTKFIGELKGHTESVIASGFSFEGDYVVTGDMNGKILIHKATKRGQVWVKHGELDDVEEVMWLKVHPKQNVFAVGGKDGSVWVYQIEPTVELIFSGYSHQKECNAGVFINVDNLDELKLVTVSEDGTIIGWNCFTQVQDFKIDSTALKGVDTQWVSIASNSTGKVVAVGSRDSHIAIINTETGTVLTSFLSLNLKDDQPIEDASIESLAWNDSLNLLAAGYVSGAVTIFDSKTWRIRKSLHVEGKGDIAITQLQFLDDSAKLVGSSYNGKVYEWDARTGEVLHTMMGHYLGVLAFSIDNSGKRLITAGDEGVSLVFPL
ncbi:unnamed protein product [Ambrosiozyma monospora]|uniref:Unnamed protein product n=1 Tax=Ambrosiozyma monospora TaxID=43982 RepID=A0A9W7DE04_AMBMO|nr:unnamed protein product [Ambrosiozyma monospora]